MTTLPSAKTKEFPQSSIEKKVHNIVELFAEQLPIPNDRIRLAFGLYKFLSGEGDPPKVLVASSKLKIEGITTDDLAKKIDEQLKKITKESENSD
jgi:stress response protein YsnF